MSTTTEQQLVIDKAQDPLCKLLKVSACSGAGKTFTLVELVKAIKPTTGMYIAYNKAIATEAGTKFPNAVECSTTHSLAWRATVRQFGLRVGYIGYRDITADVPYERKLVLIEAVEEFCLSKYLTFTNFIYESEHYDNMLASHGEQLLTSMSTGDVPCTHSFYLKLYHILLVDGHIEQEELDILLLDEAGDLNEVTLEIFLAFPAKKRVMVGDPNQNIYSFNNTINGFAVLEGQGDLLYLTNSFRVSAPIARQIEAFSRDTFDTSMQFKGIEYTNNTLDSFAFISRTNGQLINKMMDLNLFGTPYNLVRSVKSIFELPMVLIGLKKGGKIYNPNHKFLQDDTDDYYKSISLQKTHKTALSYIAAIHADNASVKSAINMIQSHKPGALIDAKDIALKYERSKQVFPLTLCSSHSSKGLEYDSVEIADDTNQVVTKILDKPKPLWTSQDYEELRLFYVAVSRARKEVTNAIHLDKYIEGPTNA